MINICEICKIEFESNKPARTCSAKCRVTLSRLRVTKGPNVTFKAADVTPDVTFEFYTQTVPNGLGRTEVEKSPVRTAKYWYQVPTSAIPVLKKDYPEMPDYMDGRQYFLWWKNEFKTTKNGPELHNPFPKYDKVEYFTAAEGSRRWGA